MDLSKLNNDELEAEMRRRAYSTQLQRASEARRPRQQRPDRGPGGQDQTTIMGGTMAYIWSRLFTAAAAEVDTDAYMDKIAHQTEEEDNVLAISGAEKQSSETMNAVGFW